MKIAFVHPALTDYRLELFDALNKKYDITFIFTEHLQGKRSMIPLHLVIPSEWNYKIMKNSKKLLGHDIIMYLRLVRELIKGDYDIIISTVLTSFTSYISFTLAKIMRKKFIIWFEEWHWDDSYFIKRIKHKISKFVLHKADACIVSGLKSKELCINAGVPAEKIFIAPDCSCDHGKRVNKNLRKELNLEGEKIVLYLSRIINWKGLNYLVDAFALLEKSMNNVFLLIAGDGPFKKECEQLAKNLGIKNILWAGLIKPEDIGDYYRACDVFVLPSVFLDSWYEAWGLVINEAMAFGKPIITTDAVGAAPDMVKDGTNGYVVKNKNVDELYKALYNILSNDELKEKMGKNSRKIFEEKNDCGRMFKAFVDAINYAKKINIKGSNRCL